MLGNSGGFGATYFPAFGIGRQAWRPYNNVELWIFEKNKIRSICRDTTLRVPISTLVVNWNWTPSVAFGIGRQAWRPYNHGRQRRPIMLNRLRQSRCRYINFVIHIPKIARYD